MAALLDHPTFKQARTEVEALGFAVSGRSFSGSAPYAVIGGRSNNRWWLIPLGDRRTTVSGLALFQPVLASARFLKRAAAIATSLGLTGLWARQVLHIGGQSPLGDLFRGRELRYAFFTGTDSPHRKLAVQIMEQDGTIRGFVKAGLAPAVRPLLAHEASCLERVRNLGLQTASIPTVLFHGELGGATVLATDTLKNTRSRTVTSLTPDHLGFIRELAAKTISAESRSVVPVLRAELAAISDRLPAPWRLRLERGLERIDRIDGGTGPVSMAHGDFSPWNTLFVDRTLYVFDWEYASAQRAAGHDLLHFLLSAPEVARRSAPWALALGRGGLRQLDAELSARRVEALLAAYFCAYALQYAARDLSVGGSGLWPGNGTTAAILDELLGGNLGGVGRLA